MIVTRFADPDAFLQTVTPYLMRDEAANGLMLGIANRLHQNIDAFGNQLPYLAVVNGADSSDDPTVVAIMTPPHSLLVQSYTTDIERPLSLLAEDLTASGWAVPGVNGPSHLAKMFADIWVERSVRSYRIEMELRTFKLTSVEHPTYSPGRLRGAEPADLERVVDWAQAFTVEAIGENEPFDRRRARTRFAEAIEQGRIFFWDNDGLVSIVSCGRPTEHGIAINMVYTPPHLRGSGYAGSCVAALSQRLLDDGWHFCTLFTDLANPTSNSIYQRIGYRPICDFTHYLFR